MPNTSRILKFAVISIIVVAFPTLLVALLVGYIIKEISLPLALNGIFVLFILFYFLTRAWKRGYLSSKKTSPQSQLFRKRLLFFCMIIAFFIMLYGLFENNSLLTLWAGLAFFNCLKDIVEKKKPSPHNPEFRGVPR